MLRSALTCTRPLRNVVTAVLTTAEAAHGSASAHHTSAATTIGADTKTDEFADIDVTTMGQSTYGLDSRFLQDMLDRHAPGHRSYSYAGHALPASSTSTAASSSSAPAPTRRRSGATIMSKARRIRLAAAAQEAAEHLQEAGSPAAAIIHSQHVDQLREEERLLEVSLARLRAERDLAVTRHDCERELQQFRRGMRDREEAVAAMVKAKYENLRDTLGVEPAENVAAVLAATTAGAGTPASTPHNTSHGAHAGHAAAPSIDNHKHSSHAATSMETPSGTAVSKPQLVYRQGALDVQGEEDASEVAPAAGKGIDVEEAMAVRFLMDMDATADAEDALEAASTGAVTTGRTHRTRARHVVKKKASASSASRTAKRQTKKTPAKPTTRKSPSSRAQDQKKKAAKKSVSSSPKTSKKTDKKTDKKTHKTKQKPQPAKKSKATTSPARSASRTAKAKSAGVRRTRK